MRRSFPSPITKVFVQTAGHVCDTNVSFKGIKINDDVPSLSFQVFFPESGNVRIAQHVNPVCIIWSVGQGKISEEHEEADKNWSIYYIYGDT